MGHIPADVRQDHGPFRRALWHHPFIHCHKACEHHFFTRLCECCISILPTPHPHPPHACWCSQVDFQHTEIDEHGVMLGFGSSVTLGERPAVSGAVRGVNHPGCGWRFTPVWPDGQSGDPDEAPSTALTYVIHTDLKGWLPAWAINSSMTSTFHQLVTSATSYMGESKAV